MTTDTEKEFIETVIPADQARLYELDGWDIIGYREDGAERVADIRRRIAPVGTRYSTTDAACLASCA